MLLEPSVEGSSRHPHGARGLGPVPVMGVERSLDALPLAAFEILVALRRALRPRTRPAAVECEIPSVDHIPGRKHRRAHQQMLELANVPGKRVRSELL